MEIEGGVILDIIPKLQIIDKNFIVDYLRACGVEDIDRYIHPDNSCFDDPFDYPNMKEAILSWDNYYHTTDNQNVGIVIDSDADGACSSAVIYLYLKSLNITPIVFYHTGKQHGLDDVLDEILNSNISFLFVPDAGTNNINECKILKENGVQIIVLDHHEVMADNPYAIVVNHHLGKNLNTALSGTGVAYKFVQAYWRACGNSCLNDTEPDFHDLVAISIVSDICDLTSLENRAFIDRGLNNLSNPFLILLFEKLCKKRGYTPSAVGWDIAPLANALARSDEQESKLIFFKGLIGEYEPEKALKEMRRVKRIQDNSVKEVVAELEPTLNVDHKAIIGFSSADNKTFLGLIANKFSGKYNKPTILLRELNPTQWTGSLRSPVDLATKINDSGLAKAQGHEAACGITIDKSKLKKFTKWIDGLDLEERPAYTVAACISPENLNINITNLIQNAKILWGQGICSPQFYMRLQLNKSNVFVYKKNITTLKLQVGDLAILKFFASEKDIEAFSQYDEFEVELIVGDCETNEYMGSFTPQCNIVNYEIHPITKKDTYEWEDIFK